jgi:hypothetical protein
MEQTHDLPEDNIECTHLLPEDSDDSFQQIECDR